MRKILIGAGIIVAIIVMVLFFSCIRINYGDPCEPKEDDK